MLLIKIKLFHLWSSSFYVSAVYGALNFSFFF